MESCTTDFKDSMILVFTETLGISFCMMDGNVRMYGCSIPSVVGLWMCEHGEVQGLHILESVVKLVS
jgi:hypothetical protein